MDWSRCVSQHQFGLTPAVTSAQPSRCWQLCGEFLHDDDDDDDDDKLCSPTLTTRNSHEHASDML